MLNWKRELMTHIELLLNETHQQSFFSSSIFNSHPNRIRNEAQSRPVDGVVQRFVEQKRCRRSKNGHGRSRRMGRLHLHGRLVWQLDSRLRKRPSKASLLLYHFLRLFWFSFFLSTLIKVFCSCQSTRHSRFFCYRSQNDFDLFVCLLAFFLLCVRAQQAVT